MFFISNCRLTIHIVNLLLLLLLLLLLNIVVYKCERSMYCYFVQNAMTELRCGELYFNLLHSNKMSQFPQFCNIGKIKNNYYYYY